MSCFPHWHENIEILSTPTAPCSATGRGQEAKAGTSPCSTRTLSTPSRTRAGSADYLMRRHEVLVENDIDCTALNFDAVGAARRAGEDLLAAADQDGQPYPTASPPPRERHGCSTTSTSQETSPTPQKRSTEQHRKARDRLHKLPPRQTDERRRDSRPRQNEPVLLLPANSAARPDTPSSGT